MEQNGGSGRADRLGTGLLPNAKGAMVTALQTVVMVGRFHCQDGKKERQDKKGNE